MKKINRFTTYVVVLLVLLAMSTLKSCNDNGQWEPGPQPAANNPGVYFDKSIPSVVEVEADQQGILLNESITLQMGRDASKAGTALQVPIKVRYAESNLTISGTANFETGASTTLLTIRIGEFEFGKQYPFSVEVDENYSNPYKVYDEGENGGSTRIEATIEVVCVLGTATFTPTDYTGETQPQFTPFEHKIYDKRNGSYIIKNFLYNNAGYNFSFSIDEENNIRPLAANGYHSDSENRWYFYSENSDASTARIPCYIPGANPNDYVTYIYFYTAENTASYQDFWMDLSSKTGRMMGYSRYSISSSGRIAFNFAWE